MNSIPEWAENGAARLPVLYVTEQQTPMHSGPLELLSMSKPVPLLEMNFFFSFMIDDYYCKVIFPSQCILPLKVFIYIYIFSFSTSAVAAVQISQLDVTSFKFGQVCGGTIPNSAAEQDKNCNHMISRHISMK